MDDSSVCYVGRFKVNTLDVLHIFLLQDPDFTLSGHQEAQKMNKIVF